MTSDRALDKLAAFIDTANEDDADCDAPRPGLGEILCVECDGVCRVDPSAPIWPGNPPIYTYRCTECGRAWAWSPGFR